MSKSWNDLLTLGEENETCWELFHENSKTERHDRPPSSELVRAKMAEMWTSLDYLGYESFELPPVAEITSPLSEVLRKRVTARNLRSCNISTEQLSQILFYCYGETRSNEESGFPRSFRVIPSGGAMYPLEIYLHSAKIEGLPAGLYHYNSDHHSLQLVQAGDKTHLLCDSLVQNNIPLDSAVQFFITALFERSTFKYSERGYRFVLLEAGHVAQNINLVSTSLGLGVINIGGYFDREIDSFLGLDGIAHSTVYMQAIGSASEGDDETVW